MLGNIVSLAWGELDEVSLLLCCDGLLEYCLVYPWRSKSCCDGRSIEG
jgi:hypothetical protein